MNYCTLEQLHQYLARDPPKENWMTRKQNMLIWFHKIVVS